MKLKSKLTLSFLSVTLPAVILAAVSIYTSTTVARSLGSVTENGLAQTSTLHAMRAAALEVREGLASAGSTANQERARDAARRLVEASRRYADFAEELPLEHPLAGAAEQLARELLAEIEGGAWRAAGALKSQRLIELIDFSLANQIANLRDRARRAQAAVAVSVRAQQIGSLSLVALACMLALWLAYTLSHPIAKLRQAALDIARGRHGQLITLPVAGELADLMTAFNEMSQALDRSMVSKAELFSIIDSMSESLLVVDQHGLVATANRASAELLGYSVAELNGMPFAAIAPGSGKVLEMARLGRSAWGVAQEITCRTKTGRDFPVLFSAAPLLDVNKSCRGVVCVARDISARKQAEAEAAASRRKLQQLERLASLGTVSALVAHKLNQPLTTTRLFLQQVKRTLDCQPLPSLVNDNLEQCLQQIAAMSRTIKEILQETHALRPRAVEDLRLGEIAALTRELLLGEARAAQLEIVIESMEQLPSVLAAREDLEQVFFLLMQNAVEAAPRTRPAQLLVRGEVHGDRLAVVFADSCGGVSRGNEERIFEEFFTTKAPGKGSGLGLNIVQQTVRGYRGSLCLENNPGVGAVFVLNLPRPGGEESKV